jgi:hypothetical protein
MECRIMMKTLTVACILLTGCTTAVAPQGMKIETTQNPTIVENCVVVGAVQVQPPYIWPGDDLKQLKNNAVLLGADTVFVTSRFGTVFGMAYICNPSNATGKVSKKSIESVNKRDFYSELIKLKELLDKGIINQEEFDQQKEKILN